MSEELSARLRRVEQQVRVFKELHQSELQIILDELTDIAKQVDAERAAAAALLAEIERGETLYAERVQPGEPKIMTHRGSDIL